MRPPQGIRMAWWAEVMYLAFGGYWGWQDARHDMLREQYVEDYSDAFGTYCAGGEL